MAENEDDIAAISQEGYRLMRENRLEESADSFRQVLDQDPGNCYALVGLGDVARKSRRYEEAIQHYVGCLDSEPKNTYALFGLADSYKSQRQYKKAIDVWERYLLQDSSNVTVLTRVADVYRKVKNRERSQELYLAVLEIEPDNRYALIGLGHLHYDFREYSEALSYWQRMHEIDGGGVDIRVLTSIGNCYRKLKRFQDGLPYFEDALSREENNFYALFGLADCYRGLNDPRESLRYWDRILHNDPLNKVILTRAGDAHRAMGDYEAAEGCYNQALEIEHDLYAVLGRAIIARRRGHPEQAVEMLAELMAEEPRNPRVYQEIAQTHIQMGEQDEAISVLREFKKSGIHNSYVDDLLGRLLEDGLDSPDSL